MTSIRVIDFETNGFEPTDDVVEVGTCDVHGDARGWLVDEVSRDSCLHACLGGLKPEARAVHHISPHDLDGTKPFSRDLVIKEALSAGISALAAHSWDFEKKWLGELPIGLHAICTYKSALRIWPDAPSHSNGALRYWLEDQKLIAPSWNACQPPHRAGPDAYVTAWLLKALLEAGATGKDMVAWTKEPRLLTKCPIGKQKGKPWSDIDAGFLGWCMRQPDMEEDIKWNVRREIDRRAAL